MNIVLVDDDKDDQMIFKKALQDLQTDAALQVFSDGCEVLGHLEACEKLPDILFLDLNMPKVGGLDVLKKIRNSTHLKSLTVAIYSTSAAEKDVEDTFLAGANVYIAKPTSMDKLREALSRVLSMNAQFLDSGLNKDTFLLSL